MKKTFSRTTWRQEKGAQRDLKDSKILQFILTANQNRLIDLKKIIKTHQDIPRGILLSFRYLGSLSEYR